MTRFRSSLLAVSAHDVPRERDLFFAKSALLPNDLVPRRPLRSAEASGRDAVCGRPGAPTGAVRASTPLLTRGVSRPLVRSAEGSTTR